ncbi:MAG: MerR family transcriptional regulator [Acidobacteriota bacterium]|nr:MerR family transcriptional regulator [Acidobacteriota bacterium]
MNDDRHIENAEASAIPDKLFFRIGEVSQLVGVEPYVLRYWESEFPGLSPRKSNTGQRMFRRKDVEMLLNIKQLLYDRKFTIEGARKALKSVKSAPPAASAKPARQEQLFPAADPIPAIRQELSAILKLLT